LKRIGIRGDGRVRKRCRTVVCGMLRAKKGLISKSKPREGITFHSKRFGGEKGNGDRRDGESVLNWRIIDVA